MTQRSLILGLVVLSSGWGACEQDKKVGDTVCDSVNTERGELTCLNSIQDDDDVSALSIPTVQGRIIKFLSPAGDGVFYDSPTFMATRTHSLHLDFLRDSNPDVYGSLQNSDYSRIFFAKDRTYFSGYLRRDLEGMWRFAILESDRQVDSHITREQAISVWNQLQPAFKPGELLFEAQSGRQMEAAKTWANLPFGLANIKAEYQAYNLGRGCGYLKVLALDELPTLVENGDISFRNIVAIDVPPADLEVVVSGIITELPQGPLSHLAVRSASRGTINASIPDFDETLAGKDGQLVCIDIEEEAYTLTDVSLSEAESFWNSIRPTPITLPSPNTLVTDIAKLRDLPTDTLAQRQTALGIYGAKGTNLAALYQRIDAHDSYKGLLIPASYYERFINENTWMIDLGAGVLEHTFKESLTAWLSDKSISDNPFEMRIRLDALRAAMQRAPVPSDIIDEVRNAIVEHYDNETTMVRFRSSSNAEDQINFSGAGLYESTSGCSADGSDGEELGPSRCDSDQSNERSLQRALTKVWSSTWKISAFNERAWYGMNQGNVVMSILVNDRAKNEKANIVAFSGNPTLQDDDRLLLTAQVGEYSVVSPLPEVQPEVIFLHRDGNSIVNVERVSQSTVASGQVLSNAEAIAIGEQLIELETTFPMEGIPDDKQLIWDTEWKVLSNDQLVIKQIRPFLKSN